VTDLRADIARVRSVLVELLALDLVSELTMERLAIAEPEKTWRLRLYNNGSAPAAIFKGESIDLHPEGRPGSGHMYVNDEGTECGGLMFHGPNEAGNAGIFSTMDHHDQQEVLIISSNTSPTGGNSSLGVVDMPEWSIVDWAHELVADRAKGMEKAQQEMQAGNWFQQRALARGGSGSSRLELDAPGTSPIKAALIVDEHGPRLELVDGKGQVRVWSADKDGAAPPPTEQVDGLFTAVAFAARDATDGELKEMATADALLGGRQAPSREDIPVEQMRKGFRSSPMCLHISIARNEAGQPVGMIAAQHADGVTEGAADVYLKPEFVRGAGPVLVRQLLENLSKEGVKSVGGLVPDGVDAELFCTTIGASLDDLPRWRLSH
jgi:hypothetical protein